MASKALEQFRKRSDGKQVTDGEPIVYPYRAKKSLYPHDCSDFAAMYDFIINSHLTLTTAQPSLRSPVFSIKPIAFSSDSLALIVV